MYVLAVILLLAIVLVSVFFGIWHNEFSTVTSFTMLRDRNDAHKDGTVYSMKVSGGFYFDDFLEQGGAKNDSDLIAFISKKITRGLMDVGLKESDIGCASFTATTVSGDKLFARNYDFEDQRLPDHHKSRRRQTRLLLDS